ncbi:MAG: putative prenyltransferase [Parcubacteria bacterium C7867-008]|nr:MAG: putative prenyltransferase [Parcubacteria bacterium C7867-008]
MKLNLLKRIRTYQKERFPLVVLLLSLVPAILSSGAVVGGVVHLVPLLCAVVVSVAYLAHIRIIDEQRDYLHDNEYHKTRPIQAGVITLSELRTIDLGIVVLILAVSFSLGLIPLITSLVLIAYSYLAGREFFLGERLRSHFFLYNSVNLLQMVLMQVLVYAMFGLSTLPTALIVLHFLFTTSGTLIFEFLRKVKIPGEDGTGKDTYTWYVPFGRALWIYFLLFLVTVSLFFLLILHTQINQYWWMWIGIIEVCSALFWTILHSTQKTHKTEQALQGSFLLNYAILNMIIYFAII